jgi:ABC-type uncharacterized transport system substrate-binding protein
LRRRIFLFLIAIFAFCGASRAGAEPLLNVEIVLSEDSVAYRQFASLLQSNADGRFSFSVSNTLSTGRSNTPDISIALGLKALEFLQNRKEPVIAALVSSNDFAAVNASSGQSPRAAVYIDQPKSRQLYFLRALQPKISRVGVIYSQQSVTELAQLRLAAAEQNLVIEANFVSSPQDIFISIESVIHRADLLLALPDSSIYNASNVRSILLTTYRDDIPLIGLSQAYVNAGALAAIFSSPEQMSEDVIGIVRKFSQSGVLPAAQHPASFNIAINSQVASSMSLSLPSPVEIRRRMQVMERSR